MDNKDLVYIVCVIFVDLDNVGTYRSRLQLVNDTHKGHMINAETLHKYVSFQVIRVLLLESSRLVLRVFIDSNLYGH